MTGQSVTPSATPVRWWREPVALDALLAAAVAGMTTVGVWQEMLGATRPVPVAWPAYVLAVAVAVALVWRRRAPAASAVVVFVLCTVYHLAGYPGWAPAIALFVAVYSLAAYADARWWLPAALALCVLGYLVPVLPPYGVPASSPAVWGPAAGLLWVALVAVTVRRGREQTEDRIRRAAELAATLARQRMVEDRLRIARELHDVLAHEISVITVQSNLALDAFDDDRTTTRGALMTIRTSSRRALAQLRSTVGLLRENGTRSALPQPRLADLPDLAARAEASGVRVHLDLTLGGEADDDTALPAAVELTMYRVAQEALTNVVRHADAANAWVTLARTGAQAVVRVRDDGRGSAPAAQGAGGFGLLGMRERTEALGGRFTAAPGPDGGFEICARFPIEERTSRAAEVSPGPTPDLR
jgi:signal transduction histidine kinase